MFNSTPLERRLAVLLGIPLNGVDPSSPTSAPSRAAARSSARPACRCRRASRTCAAEHEVEAALAELKGRKPVLRKAVVKLNDSFSGEGNALFRYPEGIEQPDEEQLRAALTGLELTVPWETRETYFEKFARMGGIVEEFIEARRSARRAPSCASARAARCIPHLDPRPDPRRQQRAGLPRLQLPGRRRLPPRRSRRRRCASARCSRGKGVVSRFAIDFLVWREALGEPSGSWRRWRSTCAWAARPTRTSRFSSSPAAGSTPPPASSSTPCPATPSTTGRPTTCSSESYRGLLPEDLIEILTDNQLHYSHGTESGVLFHLIGALSEFGKLGLTAIANSRPEVERLYQHALDVLDREAGAGR